MNFKMKRTEIIKSQIKQVFKIDKQHQEVKFERIPRKESKIKLK